MAVPAALRMRHVFRAKGAHMTEEQYWSAVQDRSREADGAFVFAVRSTGVYCRPSCPSRRPLRRNVEFFLLPDVSAKRDHFRAIGFLQPSENDGGVQPARISDNDFFHEIFGINESIKTCCARRSNCTHAALRRLHQNTSGVDGRIAPRPKL